MQQPDININCTNSVGETPLLKAIRYSSENCAAKLIEVGANISTPCIVNRTPLHEAVGGSPSLYIAHLLIEKGADINALDWDDNTPLHRAVRFSNFEMVAMLLYYGADTDIVDSYGFTPFMLAIERNEDAQIQELLLEYEVDFNRFTMYGASTLSLAMCKKSPLVKDIIERGADVNYSNYSGNAFKMSLKWKDSSAFKMIWPTFNHHVVYEGCYHHMLYELDHNSFSARDWLECMMIVFCSDAAYDIIHDVHGGYASFFAYLINMFFKRDLSESDLFPFACISLSLGAEVCSIDVQVLYNFYGYNETLKLFLQVGVDLVETNDYPTLPVYICDVNKYHVSVMNECRIIPDVYNINKLLYYFTPTSKFTHKIQRYSELDERYVETYEKLKKFAVPSLLELARDMTRKAICVKYNITKCLWFYTVLNQLEMPSIIKKIIAYEVPVRRSI